jgi:phosphate transport system permease protein
MASIAATGPSGKRSVKLTETSGRATMRRVINWIMTGLIVAGALVGCGILFLILGYIVVQGAPALNFAFFTQRPAPLGEVGGGVAPAILGTLTMVGIGGLIGVPVGVGAGIYLAEFGRGRFATIVRFVADLMTGLPSIAIGAFTWAILVRRVFNSYNPIAGGVALSIIMIPIITRTTCARRPWRSARRPGRPSCRSSCRLRAAASSPASSSRSLARPGRPPRCC